ncbi:MULTISPECIES: bactofilin family protein [Ralstonia]|jgi:hypothetical protein|uniref:Integral membrane protein CcmA involved in cell shape determination n=2 Tax=Ralstonia pickettii TaxID=329 RepID=R0E6R2_RALPI|nr:MULTISPECIES: polymer-forming cytoskeletal protein [Ralstonia]ENZ77814.1 hypothetical protein OR214_02090 [Ralstonia pickettii OR214]MCM3582085.1 polymer-forming cytoskeletal protein [Ralstonia pickettii]
MNNTPMNDQKPETVSCVLSIDPAKEKITAVLPAGATIEGSLRLKEGGRIGGVVKGNVVSESGTLLIDSSAIVEGDVVARGRCIVLGQVGTSSHRTTIRCEKVDGLTISHAAQIHANIEHNGISATNVSGQIQRIADMAQPHALPPAAEWRAPGQDLHLEDLPSTQPPALTHDPSPVANFTQPPAQAQQTPALRVVISDTPQVAAVG